MLRDQCLYYFREFLVAISGDVSAYASRKKQLILPQIPLQFVKNIIREVTIIFKNEPNLLSIKAPVVVCGDLHGHILDLFRILKQCGSPEAKKFIFLGDIVDRGEFSVECIILIYIMKIVWPDNVSIIRGNHEFGYLCSQCGFLEQLLSSYGEPMLFQYFISSFNYNTSLCIHGGLSPSLQLLSQIKNLQRPVEDWEDDVLNGLVWSDPDVSGYCDEFSPSSRGTGYLYGQACVERFLRKNGLKYLIRGHECVQDGLRVTFNSVITVFSASNYCGVSNNDGAYILMKSDDTYDIKPLPALDYLLRSYVIFSKGKTENERPLVKISEPKSARIIQPKPLHSPMNNQSIKSPRVSFTKNKLPALPAHNRARN
ncbi:Ser/Thr protein phosphatase, putative [Trichomonas vaginalis G3]|uniref:Serine/threonine-protein phosphatase n=1 Tax=Trichomonas vaginalis (strain ATCC PRA-98 / G3) TaxID=412133 RepID=A2FF06_TRIV3|nr:phosphoprotein phosphatase protein [Trichomonas vaginalis G3]EAX96510.1 Ser/Thr protein phosphatase, putative [Trichomonas vaginalis G3]KAI5506499.1 phosphoprotein phosphatase protein [Trichomonas vaginalis G3]|eukprot:XP_001309440.1 Ser/Thr protein phosphatase [Trichomonas vaginalis G3]